jgi:hypothetical protein
MKLTLTDFKELKNFPSGSAIEFHDNKVFLAGDDAKEVLVLDKSWKELERIPLFASDVDRIPKAIKSDLEATTVVIVNSIPRMLILGSGSKEELRNKAVLLDLDSYLKDEFDLTVFYNRIKATGIADLNIESAATLLEDYIILGNRGNKRHPDNHLIITKHLFWKHQADVELFTLPIKFPGKDDKFKNAGISGLTYSPHNDWLVFTASTELTNNPVEDGPIGESYLGIIENASRKIGRKDMKVDEFLELGEAEKSMRGYKIESVCIQSEKDDRLKLQLVADNDDGISCLFKVRIKL